MKNVIILGAGESGVGAALLAQKENYSVFVSEYGKIKDEYKSELIIHDIPFEENGHDFEKIETVDLIVKSPGIPEKAAVVQLIRKKNIELISEIEFAFRYCPGKIIAITGSNGKTTTTLLTYHIFSETGKSVEVGGNVGRSFARILVEEENKDYYIIEVSSFQLDDIRLFKPDVAILLNITPDHLDRYDYNIDNYAAAKLNITKNQDGDNVLIYNAEDEGINTYLSPEHKNKRLISIQSSNIENRSLLTSSAQKIDIQNYKLKGLHNIWNAQCAIEAALAAGISTKDIENALAGFSNVEHRLEKVAQINNILYVNDSKATNVDSVYFALGAFDTSIIWIAGGTDKGNDYKQLLDLVKEKVKALICLGVDNSKLLEFFSPHIKIIEETQDIENALRLASTYAEQSDVVLLSPACASFDLFNNYEHRGKLFKQAVFSLIR